MGEADHIDIEEWPEEVGNPEPGDPLHLAMWIIDCQGCSKWVSQGIRDRYFFVGIIYARMDIEARVGILTGRIC